MPDVDKHLLSQTKTSRDNTRLFWLQLTQTSDLYLLTLSLGYELLLSFFLIIIIIWKKHKKNKNLQFQWVQRP